MREQRHRPEQRRDYLLPRRPLGQRERRDRQWRQHAGADALQAVWRDQHPERMAVSNR